eukprot:m51a1_g4981 hypothetical protein (191) ;mRNA; r:54061-58853
MSHIHTLEEFDTTSTASDCITMLSRMDRKELQRLLLDDKFRDLTDELSRIKAQVEDVLMLAKEAKQMKANKKVKQSAQERRRYDRMQRVMDLYIDIMQEMSDDNIKRVAEEISRRDDEIERETSETNFQFALRKFESILARCQIRSTFNNTEIINIVRTALECRDEYINERRGTLAEWVVEFDNFKLEFR